MHEGLIVLAPWAAAPANLTIHELTVLPAITEETAGEADGWDPCEGFVRAVAGIESDGEDVRRAVGERSGRLAQAPRTSVRGEHAVDGDTEGTKRDTPTASAISSSDRSPLK